MALNLSSPAELKSIFFTDSFKSNCLSSKFPGSFFSFQKSTTFLCVESITFSFFWMLMMFYLCFCLWCSVLISISLNNRLIRRWFCFEKKRVWKRSLLLGAVVTTTRPTTSLARTSYPRSRSQDLGGTKTYFHCRLYWFNWNSGILLCCNLIS